MLASLVMLLGLRAGSEVSARAAGAMLFALGPFVVLAGLHGRVGGFLHAKHRAELLALPLETSSHWRSASFNRRRGFVISALLVTATLVAGSLAGWVRHGPTLVAEWLTFLFMASVLEPMVPAWSAYLGRRFAEDSAAKRAQSGLGGGWTQPEAVVHLYAPAIMLLAAAALAMPAQLSIERWASGQPLETPHWLMSLAPLGLALYWRRDAARLYGVGMHEAVPWVHEAERTLSGPPAPRRTPLWLGWLRDPWTRARAISMWRITAVANLRLLGLGLATALPWLSGGSSWALALPFSLALLAIWLAPLTGLRASRWRWEAMTRRLPAPRSIQMIDLRLGLLWGLVPTALVGASLVISFILRGVAS